MILTVDSSLIHHESFLFQVTGEDPGCRLVMLIYALCSPLQTVSVSLLTYTHHMHL